MPKQRPIERTFPINQVNEIAEREAHAKRYYRPIYTMHKWWARRLGSVFRAIAIYSLFDDETIEEVGGQIDKDLLYFEKDETARLWNLYLQDVKVNDKVVVLDPMMGGGTSIVEALRLGANVIGCDLNPVAWFVVKKEIEPVDINDLDVAFNHLEQTVAPGIVKYYKTQCPVCQGEADAMYYFWVKELPCVNCGRTVPLFREYRIASSRSTSVEHHTCVICAECETDFAPSERSPDCPNCGWTFSKGGYQHVMCPECAQFFEVQDYRQEHSCPECGTAHVAYEGNTSGQYYTCADCSQKYGIVEAIAQSGKPPERLFAVEYYCSACDRKGYKPTSADDQALYEKAAQEFAGLAGTLPIPDQHIPMGYNTRQMINYGYTEFQLMFNDRQLLCLGTLLRAILQIQDANLRELLLLAFSQTLDFSNMFCKYDPTKNHMTDLFRTHAYHPSLCPVENNPWGTDYGRNTFSRHYEMLAQGKAYLASPFDKFVAGQKLDSVSGGAFEGKIVSFDDELGETGNTLLLCTSSDFLPLHPGSVSLILTDPPYYDNVMYSELADFFYVWLRLALKDEYPHFRAELTPKSKEVILNPARDGKASPEDFLRDLQAIFAECHRVLTEDGLMIFTYHHKEDQAWSAVLGALLNAGFYITAAWPIHSEMSTSTHIYEKKNISYDTIIVARKREGEGGRISWRNLEDQIYARASEIVQFYIHENGKYVSDPDMGVIAQAKCLELYSQHYPNVMEGGEPVSVQEAVKRTTDIVTEQLIEERFQALTAETDTLSALYLLFLADRDSITYNSLDKWLRGRGADVEDFTDRQLLRQEGNLLRVTSPESRLLYIENTTRPLAVDGAHYLYAVIKHGDLEAQARRWADRRTTAAAKELHTVTGDEAYERIAEYLERIAS